MDDTTYLSISAKGKMVRLESNDILFMQARGDYVMVHTPERKFITHGTIKAMETIFSPDVFIRVHRSFIVNTTKITSFNGKALQVHGMMIPVAKRNRLKLRQAAAA